MKIKQLCQQYTLNVTKDMARSLRALEREVVELQGLADSTGEREHVNVFKSKNSALSDLLGFSAQGALLRVLCSGCSGQIPVSEHRENGCSLSLFLWSGA